jgi:hypothetical protein
VVVKETMKIVVSFVVGLVLVAVLIVLAWSGYWWVTRESTQRRAEISRSTFEFQQAHRDELVDLVAEIDDVDVQITAASGDTRAALTAQRAAMVSQACRLAAEIDGPLPGGTSTLVYTEC